MIKKPVIALCCMSLMAVSSVSYAVTPSIVESTFSLIKSGDVKYITSVAMSKLPKAALDLAPDSFIKYNALRLKNNHNNGIGGGIGGGRGHKC